MPSQKQPREQSPLQQVCMQYGKDCRRLSTSYELAKFLRLYGHFEAAAAVENARHTAKILAKKSYFASRKAIQPEWQDWDEQRIAELNKSDLFKQ